LPDSQPDESSEAPKTDIGPTEQVPVDDALTDKAVDDITKRESDEVLEAEDNERSELVKTPQTGITFFGAIGWAIVIVILAAGILAVIPYTRYKIAGLVLTQNYSIYLVDSSTKQPIASATVSLAGKTAETNAQGRVDIKVKVGHDKLSIAKAYYYTSNKEILVGLRRSGTHTYNLSAEIVNVKKG
jgi:hypothetical protein